MRTNSGCHLERPLVPAFHLANSSAHQPVTDPRDRTMLEGRSCFRGRDIPLTEEEQRISIQEVSRSLDLGLKDADLWEKSCQRWKSRGVLRTADVIQFRWSKSLKEFPGYFPSLQSLAERISLLSFPRSADETTVLGKRSRSDAEETNTGSRILQQEKELREKMVGDHEKWPHSLPRGPTTSSQSSPAPSALIDPSSNQSEASCRTARFCQQRLKPWSQTARTHFTV